MKKNNAFIGNIFLNNGVIKKGAVISEKGIISDVTFNLNNITDNCFQIFNYNECIISPGYIDIHIHGGWGYDFTDADVSGIKVIAANLLKHGVTGFLPTLSCAPVDVLINSIKAIITAVSELKAPKILGINLEGPFLNKKMKGGLNDDYILMPDANILLEILKESKGYIKNMTIAPEMEGAEDLIKILKENNVAVSAGHTMASYEKACKVYKYGVSNITHIFNAMKPIHHRDPGIITSALLEKNISVEIIADGIHIAPPVLKLVLSLKNPSNIILVSDSIRATGLEDGRYNSATLDVNLKNKIATLNDGTLAGSTILLDGAVRNMVNFKVAGIEDAIRMATYSPARFLKMLGKKGSIEKGKDADLIVLDNDLNIVASIVSGEIAYHN